MAIMAQTLLSEDSGGDGLLMANVFSGLCCVYILLLVYWEQARVLSSSPVDYGAYMEFAKQPCEPTTWLEFFLTCLACH